MGEKELKGKVIDVDEEGKEQEVKQQPIKQIALPENVINTVLQYLSTKPFNEVSQLIQVIQKEAKII